MEDAWDEDNFEHCIYRSCIVAISKMYSHIHVTGSHVRIVVDYPGMFYR